MDAFILVLPNISYIHLFAIFTLSLLSLLLFFCTFLSYIFMPSFLWLESVRTERIALFINLGMLNCPFQFKIFKIIPVAVWYLLESEATL